MGKKRPTNFWDFLQSLIFMIGSLLVVMFFTPIGWFGMIMAVAIYKLATTP